MTAKAFFVMSPWFTSGYTLFEIHLDFFCMTVTSIHLITIKIMIVNTTVSVFISVFIHYRQRKNPDDEVWVFSLSGRVRALINSTVTKREY